MRKLLSLILFQVICFTAVAAVFTVTSNADSGPGTLRQALLDAAANGSATKDYIYFNIADVSEAGRTITVQTQLPDVTSNIVIDGSTQGGSTFGFSNAKVAIIPNRIAFVFQFHTEVAGLVIYKASNVEIYGLYISGFNYLSYGAGTFAGIIIAESQNIQIGAPNKGNMINKCNYYIYANSIYQLYSNVNNSDIKIQSNYIGYETSQLSYGSDGLYINAKNTVIGGGSLAEGNHLVAIINITGVNIKISYNINGIEGNGDITKYKLASWKIINSNDIEISYNTSVRLSCELTQSTNFKIFANKDLATIYLGALVSVSTFKCSDGIIGSEDKNLRNIFASYTGSSSPDYLSSSISNSGSNNIQVLKNEINCSRYPYAIYTNYTVDAGIPKIQILKNNDTEYSGTASPMSNIYVYEDNTGCEVCSPVTFYAKVQADATGNWKLSGDFKGKRWIANALLINSSSEFTNPSADVFGYAKITQPMCGQNNGSLELTNYKHTLRVEWYNSVNNIKIGDNFKVENLAPGNYYAILYNGNCSFKMPYNLYLYDISPVIDDSYLVKTNPTCGQSNGSISNLYITNNSSKPQFFEWKDLNGRIVGHDVNLLYVSAGFYTFTVTDVNQCSTTYGPITLINTTGPNITQTNCIITPTNCGQYTGSITNITATGTGILKYNWENAQGALVATTKDLTEQPAGVYTLQVTDDTNCGPVYTSAITIPEVNGISMDETAAVQTPVTCAGIAATVTGIKITGATTYQWFNTYGVVVGNTADLSTNNPGNYRLVVSNANGCNQTSKVYTIAQQSNTDIYGGLTKVLKDATCDLNNGSIQVVFSNNPAVLPKSYRWVNHSTGAVVATTSTPILSNIDADSYDIYVSNDTGCERFLINYSIGRTPALTVSTNNAQVVDDACNTGTGSISGISATGKSPLAFTWTDATGKTVGTSGNLLNVKAGNYHIRITDGSGCEQGFDYTVNNQSGLIAAPAVADLQLCSSGDAILSVTNATLGNAYRLYNNSTDETPVDDQKTGRFNINAKSNRSYYVSQYLGTCESQRVEVKVTVGITAVNIANTFSPNGDGINDTWKINSIESYPNALVQIFTRAGQKVFESIGYVKPFDGNYQGRPLPIGAYYYIINLNAGCTLLSGSVTIIR